MLVEVREDVRLRTDSLPMVTRSLLGETAIEFTRGITEELFRTGQRD
ncbi:MAG: hypothetical protein U0872_06780 [Planctomycetaceae bacterium]